MDIKIGQKLATDLATKGLIPSEKTAKPFSESLKESLNEVNQLKKIAKGSITDLATGKDQVLHQTMIAVEKADVSFKLMMQVRNKILSAYEEINRMQL
ncbi:Flagellar hook-basal body complex protein FliE [hydrothermal vent metagenome]|uniref:Flagellar hook-basal body complex protein FliE n=1 Tax=hydrothermal vent metagenome TaxID=652676 RepID=A0A3B1D2I6_9ZZZZ